MSVVGSSHISLHCLVGFYHMVNWMISLLQPSLELRGIKKECQDFCQLPWPKENLDAPMLAEPWDNLVPSLFLLTEPMVNYELIGARNDAFPELNGEES